jgi:RHS repeat-associated protein
VWRAERVDAHGAVTVAEGATVRCDLRWPGHWYDEETGLQYNRFRYWDPRLGRYLQSDPKGTAGGLNVYAGPKNPTVHVDLLGLTVGGGAAMHNADGDDGPTANRYHEEVADPNNIPGLRPADVGGAGDERISATKYNPEGRRNNCGFCALAGIFEAFGLPFRNADQLYDETVARLGLPEGSLPRQLMYDYRANESGLPGRYAVLQDGTRDPREYTIAGVASNYGFEGENLGNIQSSWERRYVTIDGETPEQRVLNNRLRAHGIDPDDFDSFDPVHVNHQREVQQSLERYGHRLTGHYVIARGVESGEVGHFIHLTLHPDGNYEAFDHQNGRRLASWDDIEGYLGGKPEFAMRLTRGERTNP